MNFADGRTKYRERRRRRGRQIMQVRHSARPGSTATACCSISHPFLSLRTALADARCGRKQRQKRERKSKMRPRPPVAMAVKAQVRTPTQATRSALSTALDPRQNLSLVSLSHTPAHQLIRRTLPVTGLQDPKIQAHLLSTLAR